MVDKNLLNEVGIQINPHHVDRVEGMSNKEVIQKTINFIHQSGKIRDYFAMGLGSVLFAEGFADLGADILEGIASITTKRDFDLYSALELVVGVGMV